MVRARTRGMGCTMESRTKLMLDASLTPPGDRRSRDKLFNSLRVLFLWRSYLRAHGWAFYFGGPRLFLRQHPWPWQKILLLKALQDKYQPKALLFFDTDTIPLARGHPPEAFCELLDNPLLPSPTLLMSADNNGGNAGLLFFPHHEEQRLLPDDEIFLPPSQANSPPRGQRTPTEQWRTLGKASLPQGCTAPHLDTGEAPTTARFLDDSLCLYWQFRPCWHLSLRHGASGIPFLGTPRQWEGTPALDILLQRWPPWLTRQIWQGEDRTQGANFLRWIPDAIPTVTFESQEDSRRAQQELVRALW